MGIKAKDQSFFNSFVLSWGGSMKLLPFLGYLLYVSHSVDHAHNIQLSPGPCRVRWRALPSAARQHVWHHQCEQEGALHAAISLCVEQTASISYRERHLPHLSVLKETITQSFKAWLHACVFFYQAMLFYLMFHLISGGLIKGVQFSVAKFVKHGACHARVVGSIPTGDQYKKV